MNGLLIAMAFLILLNQQGGSIIPFWPPGGGGGPSPGPSPSPTPSPAPGAQPSPKASPSPGATRGSPFKAVSTKAAPAGLPPFPSGWEPATPVAANVAARAWALLPTLWKSGKPGATTVEKLNDTWITFLAFVPSAGKRGVAAYRPKAGAGTSTEV